MSVLKRPLSLLGKMNDLMKPEGDRAATDTLPSQPSHADHMAGIIDDKRPSESEEVEGGKDGSDTEEIPMKEAEVIPDVRSVLHERVFLCYSTQGNAQSSVK